MAQWVFLRGLVREARHWGAFPAAFQAQIPGSQVVTPDLPGNGALHAQTSAPRIEDMLEACRGSLSAQGLKTPYHLLALSMGGMVARVWLERYPEEIARAVLISTSMRPHSHFYQRLRPENYPALISAGLGWKDTQKRESTILRLTSAMTGEGGTATLKDWARCATDAPVSRGNALRQLFAAARYRAAPLRSPVPTLLLAGARDRLVHPACSTALAAAWGAPCVIHPSAGHDVPLDDPAWVINQVRRWAAA